MGEAAGQFDARVFRTFRAMLGAFPLGSLVRLQSERLGVVVSETNEADPVPKVCIFHCAQTNRPLPVRMVESRFDPVIALEASSAWHFPDWENRQVQLLAEAGIDWGR